MIGEIVSDMHGMEQGRRRGGGRRRRRRRRRRRWSNADKRCGSKRRTPASAARHRDARPPTSTPPHPSAARLEVGVLRSRWRGIGREKDAQK